MSKRSRPILYARQIKVLPHCPSCGVEIQAFSGRSKAVEVGALSICDQCGGLNIFVNTETLEQRVATDEEVQGFIDRLKERQDFGLVQLVTVCLKKRRKEPRA